MSGRRTPESGCGYVQYVYSYPNVEALRPFTGAQALVLQPSCRLEMAALQQRAILRSLHLPCALHPAVIHTRRTSSCRLLTLGRELSWSPTECVLEGAVTEAAQVQKWEGAINQQHNDI